MINNLTELYYDQLRDIYDAETQLINALPRMAAKASNADLKKAFEDHLQETREQCARLEEICQRHGIFPTGETCDAMKGLIREADKHSNETIGGDVQDALLIAAANRVEHYEIAAYGVARAFADILDFKEDVKQLDESLDEESDADKKITKLAVGGLFRTGVNEAATV